MVASGWVLVRHGKKGVGGLMYPTWWATLTNPLRGAKTEASQNASESSRARNMQGLSTSHQPMLVSHWS
eukprot:8491998-Prorocentrum_lima.AAC.1